MRNLLFYILLLGTFAAYSQSNCVDVLTTALQHAACNSPTSYTGSASITVLNGSGNYIYEWQDSNAAPLFPPQTSPTANNLPPGDYIAEVTDVDNNCIETELISIGYVGLIDASITLSAFTYNPVFYNQWTFDTVKIYNYGCETRVRPEFRVSHPSGNVTTNDFSVDYYDALTGQWLPIVTQNDNGEVVGYYGDSTGVVLNQPVMSQVVRVKFHPSSDIGLYTAENDLWEVDVNGNHIQQLDSLQFVSLELMDACPSFTSSANIIDASCYGFNDGSIDLEVSGGSSPYSYQWSHGPQSQDVNTLLADTYTVVIQDAGICVLFDTLIVQQSTSGVPDNRYTDNITATSVDLVFMPSTQVDQYRFRYRPLNSSTWQVVGIGGLNTVPELDSLKSLNNLNSNTTYEWQMKTWSLNSCVDGWSSSKYFTTLCVDVDIDTISVNCHNGVDGQISLQLTGVGLYSTIWSSQQSGNIISNLASGLFVFTVLDTSGCSFTDSVFLNNPPPISTGLPSSMFVCGEDTLVDVGVFNSVLWNTGASTSSILVDTTSLYTVQVADANNCSIVDSIFVTVINGYPRLSSETLCQGDSVWLYSEGNGDYVNSWWPINAVSDSIQISPQQSTSYQLVVSQNNYSCYHTIEVEILDVPIATFSSTNISCYGGNDGVSQVTVANGSFPYSYLWSNGSTQNIANGLTSGYVNVEVLDSNNCSVFDSVLIQQPQQIGLLETISSPSCHTFADASISVVVSGGTPSYNFAWSNGDSTFFTDSLTAGLYWLQIIDANNCVFEDTFLLSESNDLVLTEDFTEHQDVLCFGDSTGEISLLASGGTSIYSFSLDNLNFQLSASFNSLSAGIYWFYVQDANNCQDSVIVIIEQPDSLFFSSTNIIDVHCFGDTNGIVSVDADGGFSPYLYSINLGSQQLSGIFSNLGAQHYIFSVVDSVGCIFEDTLIVSQPDSMSVSMSIVSASCYGVNDGELNANVLSGGSPTYQYSLGSSGYSSLGVFTGLNASIDTLFVQDSLGCEQSYIFEVLQPDSIAILVEAQEPSCFESCDGYVQASIIGGNSYTLLWSNFVSGHLNDSLCDGLISLTVTDSLGCSNYYSYDLQQPPPVYPIITQNGEVLLTDSTFLDYQWFDSNGLIQGETDFQYSPSSNGIYWVEVSDSNLCSGVSLGYDFLFSSMDELIQECKVYPTLTIDILFLESDSEVDWRIFDTQGKLTMKGVSSSFTEIDISHLRNGVYIVQFLKENNTFFKKIIKQ